MRRPERGRPAFYRAWFCACAVAGALMLTSPNAQAAACDAVQLQAIKAVQFGAVGLGARRRGWIVLDPGGGFAASNEVALLGKSLPSPGLVRVTAPPNSLVVLRAVVRSPTDPAYGVTLSAIHLGFRGRPLEKTVDDWLLPMPDSASTAPVGVDIGIGALLTVQISGKVLATQFFVSLDCVGYQPR